MDHKIVETGSDLTVAMSGRFTFVDREPFGKVVQRIGQMTGGTCAIDLSGVEFVDSAALGMLLMARDAAGSHGARLVLRGPKGHVKRVFDIAKFDALFVIEPAA
jgi:anti-anti-sigma factor